MDHPIMKHQLLLPMVFLLACSAGTPSEVTGPTMRPGQDCLRCHEKDSEEGAPEWFIAGTVFPTKNAPFDQGVPGATVIVTDPQGKEIRLTSNEVGNFYWPMPVEKPYRVAIEYQGQRLNMPFPPPSGACNACHSSIPIGGTEGRLYVPGVHPSRATCADERTIVFPGPGNTYNCSPGRCVDGMCQLP
jgi:hypothetical protein